MQKPPEIVFRSFDRSDAIENVVRERIERLQKFSRDIMGVTVVLDAPHRQQQKGRIYTCDIDITVPGKELVVNRDPQNDHAHEDVYVAIRDAFDAAERQVKKFAAKRRPQDVKRHDEHDYGKVVKLFPLEGYGFIQSPDAREIYFHENSVIEGDFDDLEVGSAVRFEEEAGREGPQASTVQPVSRAKALAGGAPGQSA